ncbi:hypothetical protein AVEN_152771-1 [Araneus ventricosus]|uniref:Uncharacterized protein n=1 Tax=Araneus ventricosus TaxID=182803 RepID=A0A4Y2Q5U0_ARAVE|nr:hypothetical protein AVEN_152771-1 [Araneus ventricosus]
MEEHRTRNGIFDLLAIWNKASVLKTNEEGEDLKEGGGKKEKGLWQRIRISTPRCSATSSSNRSYLRERPSRILRRLVYTVVINNQRYGMFRKAFYSMHGVSEKLVRTAVNETTSTGTVVSDQKGKKE